MATETTGIINSPKPKPPKPKASPKGFLWADRATATEDDRKKFAASLHELLTEKKLTHSDLTETLWGLDSRGTPRNIGKGREWLRAGNPFPTAIEAAYVAEFFGVPMARLMDPKSEFDPSVLPIRPMKPRSEWKSKDKKSNGHTNGHDTDSRWVRPQGVDPVFLKFESSKKHPTLVLLELKGDMPIEIAMAVMSMIASKPAGE